jgi:cobalt-zinc-cadmium efflux system outer membrane protein
VRFISTLFVPDAEVGYESTPRMRSLLLSSVLLLTACSVPKEAGFPDISREVEARTGHRPFWNHDGEADRAVAQVVDALLARPLSPAEAVQVALLQSPDLQAIYEELRVAQADVVQAGLFKNPVFDGFVHFPMTNAGQPHIEAGVELDFLDLLMMPARKRIAAAAFDSAKARVGGAIVRAAYDVRSAYFSLQAAEQTRALRAVILEAAVASREVARKQKADGALPELSLGAYELLAVEAQLASMRAENEAISARERLVRLLGLRDPARLHVFPSLPDLPADEANEAELATRATSQRLDLIAATADVTMAREELSRGVDFRYLGGAEVGAAFERDANGEPDLGPKARLELPLFDQHQAAIAKLRAELRRRELMRASLEIGILSEVREARARVIAARKVVELSKQVVIPMRQRQLALSQQHYDAMLLGVHELIVAKQGEIDAYRDHVEAVRDYWIARSDLGRALGGRAQ